jgi:peptide/nickel transport system substrate-binding protein
MTFRPRSTRTLRSLRSLRSVCLAVSVALTLSLAAACGSSSSSTTPSTAAPGPHQGGSLTVLEVGNYAGEWPAGLDPATNIDGAADQSQMNSIYGQLFELGAKGQIIPDLVSGYSFSNGGKTVTLDIRHGVTFQDGTPFNAQAVAFNINRVDKSSCSCKPVWPVTSVTATGPYTVTMQLSTVYAPIIASFFDSAANWIASPTALTKMGEKAFALKPVGAGPFEVVSDTPNSVLVLKRNPHYWQKGHPYLNSLTFKTVASDEAAYEAMLAGDGQAYEDMSTPAILKEAAQHFVVTNQLSTSPYDLQLNTASPPFNNIKAREAIYYATDFPVILQHIFDNLYPQTEGFTGPGGLCYSPKVPGYRTYDLAKAKALVKSLGGLTISLGTISILTAQETTEALQTQWAAAGIKSTIHSYALASLIAQFTSGKWQAMVQTAGSYDPAVGVGVGFRFLSTSPFSGVHDPHLDALLNQAAATLNLADRCKIYDQAAEYISNMAYGPFYFAFAPANVVVKGVYGPGLTTPLPSVVVTPTIPWEDVYTTLK